MQLLAAVEGDGSTPIAEALVTSVPRIRRGMTCVVVTASLNRDWVKPLAALRSRGVACVVVALDVSAFERRDQEEAARKAGVPPVDEPLPQPSSTAQEWRALRHALAEFDIAVHRVGPAVPLAEALAG
jgi:hypothetical protein